MKYQAMIFDFFGVIHDDPLVLWRNTLPATVQHKLAPIAQLLDLGAITYQEYIDQLSAASGQPQQHIMDAFAAARLNHEVVTTIKQFAKRSRLALLSNANADEVRPILHAHGLDSSFEHVLISSEIGLAKPDKLTFVHALQLLGSNAAETVFIDDNLDNVTAAQQLGIRGIHFIDHESLTQTLSCLPLAA